MHIYVFDGIAKTKVIAQQDTGSHSRLEPFLRFGQGLSTPLAPALQPLIKLVPVITAPPSHPYPQITLCLDQVLHHGTPYPNGEVESGSRALAVVRNIFQVIDDIDATHEADAAINDSNLAVKPAQALELETKSAQTIGLRPVNPQLSSHLLEQAGNLGGLRITAKTIDDDPNLDPTLTSCFQVTQHSSAGIIQVENVGLEMDTGLGLIDIAAEGRKKLTAVLQQFDTVSFAPDQAWLFARHELSHDDIKARCYFASSGTWHTRCPAGSCRQGSSSSAKIGE